MAEIRVGSAAKSPENASSLRGKAADRPVHGRRSPDSLSPDAPSNDQRAREIALRADFRFEDYAELFDGLDRAAVAGRSFCDSRGGIRITRLRPNSW